MIFIEAGLLEKKNTYWSRGTKVDGTSALQGGSCPTTFDTFTV